MLCPVARVDWKNATRTSIPALALSGADVARATRPKIPRVTVRPVVRLDGVLSKARGK